jgi:hypothetical protein
MEDDDSNETFFDGMLNDMLIRYKDLIKTRDFLEYNGDFDNNKRFLMLDNLEQEIKLIEAEINNLEVN